MKASSGSLLCLVSINKLQGSEAQWLGVSILPLSSGQGGAEVTKSDHLTNEVLPLGGRGLVFTEGHTFCVRASEPGELPTGVHSRCRACLGLA